MKRCLYFLCFVILVGSINACKKNDDPVAVSPVVGRWELNRGLLSGFVSATGLNGVALDLYNYDFGSYSSRIDIRSDKSFTENIKSNGLVGDNTGTWDYADPQLTLNYSDGDQIKYTYTSNKGVEELASPTANINFPVSNTATVPGVLQYIYRK